MGACTNLSVLSLMCWLFLGTVAAVDGAFAEEPVHFADANLKARVESQLGISDPTPADMMALTTLTANGPRIVDITGLEYATNLVNLDLGNNRISDISAIAGLTNLTELCLWNNRIEDISPLAGLTDLKRLLLSYNQISDISALGGLTHLTFLYLYGNHISNISAVAGLTNLTVLHVAKNEVSDVTAVAGLTNLTELYLNENQITDISAIAGLTNLALLSLFQNEIGDITAISGLTKLAHLLAWRNQITDLSPLLSLTNLEHVDVHGNPLSQVSCDVYIAQIRERSPGVAIDYDAYLQWTLTVSSTAGGSVEVPGDGVFAYDYGGIRPVTARPDPGYHFVFWTGTAVDARWIANPTAAETTVNLWGDQTLVAHFAPDRAVIYVDDDAAGSNDGSSWSGAYTSLQDALIDANSSPRPVEVRVAQGVYRPDRGVGIKPGDRQAAFGLLSGVTLKGGYAGSAGPDPNARDRRLYETILNGDLDGDDIGVYGWYDGDDRSTWNDNSLHVIAAVNTDASPVLDGFRVSGGYSIGSEPAAVYAPGLSGAGLAIVAAGPTVIDCDFIGNAANRGGAVSHLTDSKATLIRCTFEHNFGYSGGAINNANASLTLTACRFTGNAASTGGAIYCGAGDVTAVGCEFDGNVAHNYQGGGLFCYYASRVVLKSCVFTANSGSSGGAMNIGGWPPGSGWNELASAENCVFAGNTAAGYGGAIAGSAVLTNCTFTGNRSLQGTTVSFGPHQGALVDCILWDNLENPPVATDRDDDPLFAVVGYWADPNDPRTAGDPTDSNTVWVAGDYHLKSQAGRWDPESASWVEDDVTSAYIDAGDQPIPNGGIINKGAYGGTQEASKS
jgi:predicted outer membrane repeat protein